MLSGRRVDLIYFGSTMIGSAVNKLDVLEPLTVYLEELATRLGGRRIETEFVKGLDQDYRWGGVWYGLPLHFLVRLMVYRKDLYRWTLGHDIAPRTFYEALANAREINKRLVANGSQPVDAFCVHTTQDYHDLLMLFPYYGSWGGTVLDTSRPPRCAMTSQKFRDSLSFFANLTWSGLSPPHSSEWDCNTRLLEGKTLHTISWPSLVNVCTFEPHLCPYARTMEETLNALGLAVPPSGGKGLQNRAFLGGEGFALLRSSKFKNESWQFLSWMMDPTGRPLRDLVTAAASLSANDVILDDLEFSGDSYIKRSQIKAKSFAASLNYPFSETGWMISEVERPGRLKDLIYNVSYRVKTVEAATAQFCELVNADIDKLWAKMCPEGYVLDNSTASAPARRNCVKPARTETVSLKVAAGTTAAFQAAAGVLIGLAAVQGALMWWKRDEAPMRFSSPVFNSIIIVGCILALAAAALRPGDCMAFLWLAAVAFTLAFGSLAVKLRRIHAIFNASSLKASKGGGIKDRHLLKTLSLFVAFDVVVLGLWQGLKPSKPTVVRVTTGPLTYVSEECSGAWNSAFLGVLGCFKGVLLLYSTVLAVRTRNVQLKDMNESKFIALCVYITLLIVLLVIPVYSIISTNLTSKTATVVMVNIAMLAAPSSILALLISTKLFTVFFGARAGDHFDSPSSPTLSSGEGTPRKPSSMIVQRGVMISRQASAIIDDDALAARESRVREEEERLARLRVEIEEEARRVRGARPADLPPLESIGSEVEGEF